MIKWWYMVLVEPYIMTRQTPTVCVLYCSLMGPTGDAVVIKLERLLAVQTHIGVEVTNAASSVSMDNITLG